MVVDGADRHHQAVGDLGVGQALGEQLEDLELAVGEAGRVGPGPGPGAAREMGDALRRSSLRTRLAATPAPRRSSVATASGLPAGGPRPAPGRARRGRRATATARPRRPSRWMPRANSAGSRRHLHRVPAAGQVAEQLAPVALGPRTAVRSSGNRASSAAAVVTGQQGRLHPGDPGQGDRLDRVVQAAVRQARSSRGPAAGSPLRASSRPSADSRSWPGHPGPRRPAGGAASLGLVPAAPQRQQHAAVRLQVVLVGGEAGHSRA